MKKLLCLIAVFALTAPVFAADGDPNVLITCNDLGSGLVQVSYAIQYEDGLDPAARVRGFAFDITASNGCLITAISEYDAEGAGVPADSTQIPTLYSVYMGSIQFAVDPNFVSSFGDPVAPNTDPDALGGLGTTGVTVEMGSLYPVGGTQPPAFGDLFKIQLTDPTSAGSCTLTIIGNSTRGVCVMESGDPANIVSAGCTIDFLECMPIGNPDYANWALNGKPACWCYQRQCRGDVDGLVLGPFWVSGNDLALFNAALNQIVLPTNGICSDVDHQKLGPFWVSGNDLAIFNHYLNQLAMNVPPCSGAGCNHDLAYDDGCDTNPLPNTDYNFWVTP